jgi:hypothetical protein
MRGRARGRTYRRSESQPACPQPAAVPAAPGAPPRAVDPKPYKVGKFKLIRRSPGQELKEKQQLGRQPGAPPPGPGSLAAKPALQGLAPAGSQRGRSVPGEPAARAAVPGAAAAGAAAPLAAAAHSSQPPSRPLPRTSGLAARRAGGLTWHNPAYVPAPVAAAPLPAPQQRPAQPRPVAEARPAGKWSKYLRQPGAAPGGSAAGGSRPAGKWSKYLRQPGAAPGGSAAPSMSRLARPGQRAGGGVLPPHWQTAARPLAAKPREAYSWHAGGAPAARPCGPLARPVAASRAGAATPAAAQVLRRQLAAKPQQRAPQGQQRARRLLRLGGTLYQVRAAVGDPARALAEGRTPSALAPQPRPPGGACRRAHG